MFEEFDQSPNWKPFPEMAEPEFAVEEEYPNLEATYVLFKEEPGFDGMYDQAKDWLEMPGGMLDTFKIYPVNIA